MRLSTRFGGFLVIALFAGLAWSPWALADDGAQQVPVPDLRGLSESAALRALADAGLRVGGVERLGADDLQRQFGRTYAPGIVVQQAPPPSMGTSPQWLSRGSQVWLRMSAGVAAPEAPVPAPMPPVAPTPELPYVPAVPAPLPDVPAPPAGPYVPAAPGPATPYTGPPGTVPPPPPPPYALDGSPAVPTQPVAPDPYAPVPYAPDPYAPDPYAPAAPSPAQPLDTAPAPIDPGLIGAIRLRRRGLACEAGRGGWHVRGLGGYAFHFGTDASDSGALGGADVGYTFDSCVGADVFYRYLGVRYDRTTPAGLLGDGGDTHFVGAKVTIEGSIDRGSGLFFWAGVGPGWFKTRRLAADDSGFGILGEIGLGYMLDQNFRIRFGATITTLNSTAGRMSPLADTSARWTTSVAPTLGIEIDL